MNNGIRDFCIGYKTKIQNDKKIEESDLSYLEDHLERVNFHLHISEQIISSVSNHHHKYLFTLDEEDLEYFHKKYFDKLEDELKENLKEISDSYLKAK